MTFSLNITPKTRTKICQVVDASWVGLAILFSLELEAVSGYLSLGFFGYCLLVYYYLGATAISQGSIAGAFIRYIFFALLGLVPLVMFANNQSVHSGVIFLAVWFNLFYVMEHLQVIGPEDYEFLLPKSLRFAK